MAETSNILSSLNLVQCREVPAYVCWDAFKTLVSSGNKTDFKYSLQHNVFRYPKSHVESSYFERYEYESFKIGERNGKEFWQYWNDDISLSSICNILYDKMDSNYVFIDKYIEFDIPIWVNSGAVPSLDMRCYIEGLQNSRTLARREGRNRNIFAGNIYAEIYYIEDKDDPTRGAFVFGTNDVLSQLPQELTALKLYPFYETGVFNFDLSDQNDVFIIGTSNVREKSTNAVIDSGFDQYTTDLSGEIASPAFGISISDPTSPPKSNVIDSHISYYDHYITIDNETTLTIQTKPNNDYDAWRTNTIRDKMINLVRMTTGVNGALIEHRYDTNVDAFERAFVQRLKEAIRGDNKGIMWIRYFLCDMFIPAGPEGGNNISKTVIGKPTGTFDRRCVGNAT